MDEQRLKFELSIFTLLRELGLWYATIELRQPDEANQAPIYWVKRPDHAIWGNEEDFDEALHACLWHSKNSAHSQREDAAKSLSKLASFYGWKLVDKEK